MTSQFDSKGLPIIYPTNPENISSNTKKSSVLSLKYSDFKELVEQLNIKESIIPHRTGIEYNENFVYSNNVDDLIAKNKRYRIS